MRERKNDSSVLRMMESMKLVFAPRQSAKAPESEESVERASRSECLFLR